MTSLVMKLTHNAELLLFALCEPDVKDTEALDAKLWADEILILLDLGLAELGGTLQRATLQPTVKGRQTHARLNAEPQVGADP